MQKCNTKDRRLKIIKYLYEWSPEILEQVTKLHKCLFLYEMFQLIDKKDFNLGYLKAYKNGPVFSDVFGDFTYNNENDNFKKHLINKNFKDNEAINIDESNLRKALFIVKTCTPTEISNVTHHLDAWKNTFKEDKEQIAILKKDITDHDIEILKLIKNSALEYNEDLIIKNVQNKFFIFQKDIKLNGKIWEKIEKLATCDDLINPIYVLGIDEEGDLIID
ncbi:hypothetical protein ACJA25_00175 [Mycoplasmopsis hyopharyngis]|uniref:hypothetical protein n=1 Tax=Mycoplasmopsis hyopharyngis TaxID=29558 RepID=UPI003872E67B